MNLVWLLFSFNGRIARRTYWLFFIALFAIVLVPAFTLFEPGSPAAAQFVDIMSLLLLWPAVAIQAKRWHDRDKSALWILVNLVPVIGGIWALVENGFLGGTEGDNRYGLNPRAPTPPAP